MSWKTHPIIMRLRSIGRKTGINPAVAKLIYSKNYEDRFQTLMLGLIQPGDCVWDVGANVGLYTKRFSDLVRDQGCVFAFEPSPFNVQELEKTICDQKNVVILPVALGNREGMVKLHQGEDKFGATSAVVDVEDSTGEELIEVAIVRGDKLPLSGQACFPNVIKIDTEGYELDVLEGLVGIIGDSRLRTIGVEVHFGLLEKRGLQYAPAYIERFLNATGFRLSWPDASHIIATRHI